MRTSSISSTRILRAISITQLYSRTSRLSRNIKNLFKNFDKKVKITNITQKDSLFIFEMMNFYEFIYEKNENKANVLNNQTTNTAKSLYTVNNLEVMQNFITDVKQYFKVWIRKADNRNTDFYLVSFVSIINNKNNKKMKDENISINKQNSLERTNDSQEDNLKNININNSDYLIIKKQVLDPFTKVLEDESPNLNLKNSNSFSFLKEYLLTNKVKSLHNSSHKYFIYIILALSVTCYVIFMTVSTKYNAFNQNIFLLSILKNSITNITSYVSKLNIGIWNYPDSMEQNIVF